MGLPVFLPLVDQYANSTPSPVQGQIAVPQSPSGSVTNESATWNYNSSETSTQRYVSQMIAAQNDGTPFSDEPVNLVVDGKFDTETVPNPPSGSFMQEGTPAISNVTSITASMGGIAASAVQVFRWE